MRDSYFVRLSANRYRPTTHTAGAWNSDEQHISPLTGLIVHAIEQVCDHNDGKAICRMSFDIFGVIGLEEFSIAVRTIRPGRTIELVEATVICGGRDIVLCRAWRLTNQDTTSVRGGQPAELPEPEQLAEWDLSSVWPGGYIASLEARPVGTPQPGKTVTWLSTPVTLLADERVSDLARFIGLVDTANGIAVRESTDDWLFPNVDLTIHVYRQPRGRWLGLDTSVTFGESGHGLTSSMLYDEHGAVGSAAQMLTVRPQR